MIKKYAYNFDFFKWIKKTELVQLSEINPEDDPVRPELDNEFRISNGRKIFGLKYNNEIEGVVCIAFTNESQYKCFFQKIILKYKGRYYVMLVLLCSLQQLF